MIIITGGAGFIGSNLIAALEKSNHHPLVICDRLRSNDKWQNIAKRKPCPIIHPDRLMEFLKSKADQIEMIYHLGAISTTTEKNADLILENNFKLSTTLFKWCAEYNIRFIYASSAATYGDGAKGFEDTPSEQHLAQFRPLNAYAWSKHWFDRWVMETVNKGAKTPPQWVGLKFFNVYGPNEYHKGAQQSVISHIFKTVYKDNKPAKLFKSYKKEFTDGGQKRDFIYADDCVDLMLWLRNNPMVQGIYNVGTGEARTFLDLARAVFDAIGRKPDIDYIDMPEDLKDKYQYFTEASMSNLEKAGYSKAFTSLEAGVKKYVQHYLLQSDPYK